MTFDFDLLKKDYNRALSYIHPKIVEYWKSLESPNKFHLLGTTPTFDRVSFIINFGDQFHPVKHLGFILFNGEKYFCEDNVFYTEEEFLKFLKLKVFW